MNFPTPGSDDAIDQGCTCPVTDNHHGRGFLWDGAPVFWINGDCPLHARKETNDSDSGCGERCSTAGCGDEDGGDAGG